MRVSLTLWLQENLEAESPYNAFSPNFASYTPGYAGQLGGGGKQNEYFST